MELQHLDVKLPATHPPDFDPGAAIAVFHGWVREQVCEELLVDVADYRHVPGGPAVLLVGHQADYALDAAPPGLGLRYQRKAALPGDNPARLAQALRAALRAALRLAAEPALAGLAFALDGLRVVVNDRLLVPNTAQSAAALLPELEAWFAAQLGHEEFSLVWDGDPRQRFAVTLHTLRETDLPALLARLEPQG
jgi:hypothetical protein